MTYKASDYVIADNHGERLRSTELTEEQWLPGEKQRVVLYGDDVILVEEVKPRFFPGILI